MSIDLFDNEWSTGSGLPLANADVEITACTFGFNAKIGTDALCANITFQPLEGGDPIEQSFSVGRGWEAADNSNGLVTEDGRPRKVNNGTNYGRLIDSAVAAVKAAGAEMPFSSPRVAGGWVGTKWRVGTTPVTTKNPSTGVEKVKDAFVFTAYYGIGSDTNKPMAANAGPTLKAAVAKVAAASPTGIDGDLHAALTKLARQHPDDHDAFANAAMDLHELDGVIYPNGDEGGTPAVDGVKHVERAVLKSSGPGSIWAEANS